MIKLIHNSFEFEEPRVQIVHPGVQTELIKSASDMSMYLASVKPKRGFTYALVLALGAGECYGCNRNGDYFEGKELNSRHGTFETEGFVYRHHKNKDPRESYGRVLKSHYNDRMKRVELVIEIDDSKAPEEVHKINSGIDVPVSMAAKVPFDICSICGNRAKKRDDYCEHLKNEMTRIYPDGRQVFALNPTPTFFDISFVFKPADRTAYVLKKVASDSVLSSACLAEEEGLTDHLYGVPDQELMQKLSTLRKLSDIEKEIEGIVGKVSPRSAREKLLMDEAPKALSSPCGADDLKELGSDPEKVLGGLAHKGIMVDPEVYVKYMFNQEAPSIRDHLPGIFTRLLSLPMINDLLSSKSASLPSGSLNAGRSLLNRLISQHSLLSGPSAHRILQVTIVKPNIGGVNSLARDTPVSSLSGFGGGVLKSSSASLDMEKLAMAYALYKVAAMSIANVQEDTMLPLLTVLQNYVT